MQQFIFVVQIKVFNDNNFGITIDRLMVLYTHFCSPKVIPTAPRIVVLTINCQNIAICTIIIRFRFANVCNESVVCVIDTW